MPLYDFLLLDADDTLFDFHAAETWALGRTLEPLGLGVPVDACIDLFRRINSELWRRFELGLVTAAELRVRRFEQFLRELVSEPDRRHGLPDPALISDRYVGHLSLADFLLPGALEFLRRLSGALPVGLVTNGLAQVQNSRLDRAGIRGHFSAVVISEEVGSQKPDAGIFRTAIARLGFSDGARGLMVGDNLRSDVAGALACGLDACWFNPRGAVRDPEVHPTCTVLALEEVLPLLGL